MNSSYSVLTPEDAAELCPVNITQETENSLRSSRITNSTVYTSCSAERLPKNRVSKTRDERKLWITYGQSLLCTVLLLLCMVLIVTRTSGCNQANRTLDTRADSWATENESFAISSYHLQVNLLGTENTDYLQLVRLLISEQLRLESLLQENLKRSKNTTRVLQQLLLLNAAKSSDCSLQNSTSVLTAVSESLRQQLQQLNSSLNELKSQITQLNSKVNYTSFVGNQNASAASTCPYTAAKYFFSPDAFAWEAARNFCSAHGGDLTTTFDQTELSAISRKVKESEDYIDSVWIGLKEAQPCPRVARGRSAPAANSRTWLWVATNSITNANFWNTAEPNNCTEKCVSLSCSAAPQCGWTDLYCGEIRPYICKCNAASCPDNWSPLPLADC